MFIDIVKQLISSDKITKHQCYIEINKQQNTTNSSSTSKSISDAKLTQTTLSNYSLKHISNHDFDRNIKSMCNDLIVRWISNNIRPLNIIEDVRLHELLQFFYELDEFFL